MTNQAADMELMETDNSVFRDLNVSYKSLKNKSAYVTLIEKGFFEEYTKSLLAELINPYVVKNGLRGTVVERLVAVARVQEYLSTIAVVGSTGAEAELREAENEIKHRNDIAMLNAALDTLEEDKEFVSVFTDGYIREHAIRQTSLLAVQGMPRADILEALAGISHFQQFLLNLRKEAVYLKEVEQELEQDGIDSDEDEEA